MKLRFLPYLFAVLALTAAAVAQDPGSAPDPSPTQAPGQNPSQNSGQWNGGYGQRGGRGGMGGGYRLMGTVTKIAADHYTIKTETGDVYTVYFNANTRITKQPAGMRRAGGGGGGYGRGGNGGGYGGGGNPPQEIKATDIKVGDAIAAAGDMDATAKSVGATRIVKLDPDAAKRMQELAASFGKTWLGGKVTAINGTTITLTGALDNAPHTVAADENTTFRRRRDPITLADIQVGDTVRAEGAIKVGVFTATAVSIGGGMGGPPPNGISGPPSGAAPGLPPSPEPGPPPQ